MRIRSAHFGMRIGSAHLRIGLRMRMRIGCALLRTYGNGNGNGSGTGLRDRGVTHALVTRDTPRDSFA